MNYNLIKEGIKQWQLMQMINKNKKIGVMKINLILIMNLWQE